MELELLERPTMAKSKIIKVMGNPVKLSFVNDEEYINLTDMARGREGDAGEYIRNWIRAGSTISFLGVWEKVHNADFNLVEFNQIKMEQSENAFIMSTKKWINRTGAVGLQAKAGRYGGTYAHNEIAIHFASWLSPEFHVYFVKEFKRLKDEEVKQKQENLDWNIKRFLSKVNYKIQTDAIKNNLIPSNIKSSVKGAYYASEADLLNVALFGMTAKEWKNINNGNKKGNLRENASPEQLLVLANLETHNAEFIKEGLTQEERLERLNQIAIHQMQLLVNVDFNKLGE
ncbi:MAG: KilA-N domain-containing protein [Saprospiraceae bacterium]